MLKLVLTRCGLAASCLLIAGHAIADEAGASKELEEVTIIGIAEGDAAKVTGAAHVIDATDLEKFVYSDIQRIVREVPGVSVQVEDGYGLRPNLSIRGVATERSARITLLEDGVLIAPAPYSAPSAYYFPTAGRMAGVEVLKGPSAITQGPYTIGGALNMISQPIPDGNDGLISAELGSDNSWRMHALYGASDENFGYLLETHQWQADGFQDIDRAGGDTGLEKQDYTVKLRFADQDQSLSVKLQYAEEESQQSYLGLADVDFGDSPYRRYGLSALDNIATEHQQAIVRYDRGFGDWDFAATAYYNTHQRNWFKTEGIDFDGSDSAETFSRTSWSNVVDSVNRGTSRGGLSAPELQAILDGSSDTPVGSIQLRSNAREYYSRGVQLALSRAFSLGAAQHELEIGLRYHEDEEDRLQRNSTYHQQAGALVLDDFGLLGNAGNRIQNAEALALHVYNRIEWGNWVLSPGLRLEDIDQSRVRYETRHGRTDSPASRGLDNLRDTRDNQTDIWLPGLGAMYRLSNAVSLVAGVHKGFTAPSNAPDVDAEQAWNYELGLRFDRGGWSGELIAFHSDYENLLGICTASSGADCEVGDAFNGDAASVSGMEFQLRGELLSSSRYTVPLQLGLTYTDGEFDSDIADTDFFGDVSAGDPIPYIPQQQLNARIGIEAMGWASYLGLNYIDEVCTRAACDQFQSTDDAVIVDWSGHYELSEALSLFGRVDNLTDQADIMGRQPYGARPNKDRTATIGLRLDF